MDSANVNIYFDSLKICNAIFSFSGEVGHFVELQFLNIPMPAMIGCSRDVAAPSQGESTSNGGKTPH